MCGIIGILSSQPVTDRIIEGLKRLEYRGYDSAGIAVWSGDELSKRRSVGKISALEALLKEDTISGMVGIGHTRWATHGGVCVSNSHPHGGKNVVIVHNGIIENFQELKEQLVAHGCVFDSETDSEVIVHLLEEYIKAGFDPLESLEKALKQLKGAFALAILFKSHPHQLYAARRGSPLVIGMGAKDLFLGSDAWALAPWSSKFCYLEDGDIAVLDSENYFSFQIYDGQGDVVSRPIRQLSLPTDAIQKGPYRHYMLKEIHEQPLTLRRTLHAFINEQGSITLPKLPWKEIAALRIIACGTSYYAGCIAQYIFEKYAGIPVTVEIASEFRYRHPVLSRNEWGIFISQSGETIDTLEALLLMKKSGCSTLSIVNVPESSIAREASTFIQLLAGPEIGVASTKAFTNQIMLLFLLALQAGCERSTLSTETYENELRSLLEIPDIMELLLQDTEIYAKIASVLGNAENILFVGRGISYPLALEGALKLKEISYIHTSGYAAGELKHGPIALVDPKTPVIAVVPQDEWFLKTLSNLQEIAARGGPLFCLTSQQGAEIIKKNIQSNIETLILPDVEGLGTPLLYSIPLQLLAYYIGLHKGTDVDQPRNLAKSVTVE